MFILKYLSGTICFEHHNLYSISFSGIATLCNLSFLGKTFHQQFHFHAQPFLLSGMNFVAGLGLEVLSSESFGLIVRRFGIATRICHALFSPLQRFGGRTVGFITVVTTVIVSVTLEAERKASAVVGASKLDRGAGRCCWDKYCESIVAIGII